MSRRSYLGGRQRGRDPCPGLDHGPGLCWCPDPDPETVVQRQFDAYNAKDMEAFLATYAPAVEMRDLPSNDLLRSGHDELRAFYETRFSNANLRAELVARSVLGNMVVDTERLTGFDDGRVLDIVAINEVRDGLIRRCWFVHA